MVALGRNKIFISLFAWRDAVHPAPELIPEPFFSLDKLTVLCYNPVVTLLNEKGALW